MALLDIIIDVLKINCSVVQCSGYASDIEALFYLLFFPSVFIILFVYIVTGAIINKIGGKAGGLRILISVALYAFIIFEGYYNLFVSLSRLWWLLLATLAGLWLFIRQIIHGGGGGAEGGKGFPGFSRGGMWKNLKKATGLDINLDVIQQLSKIKDVEFTIKEIDKEIDSLEKAKKDVPHERQKTAYDMKIAEYRAAKGVAENRLNELKKMKNLED
jgi:hypothetical protein